MNATGQVNKGKGQGKSTGKGRRKGHGPIREVQAHEYGDPDHAAYPEDDYDDYEDYDDYHGEGDVAKVLQAPESGLPANRS